MKKLVLLALCFSFAFASYGQIINEFHYDNTGTDVGEFVEVYVANPIPGGIDNYFIYLYNGSNGTFYNSTSLGSLGGFSADACGRFYLWSLPTNGLQNGSPDGIALVDDGGSVVQFIGYEGSVVATNGPASGMASADISPIAETSGTPVGASIEWSGSGWVAVADDTPGAINSTAAPCVPGAAVPTMGEWGLIILFLLLLNIGTVFFMRRRTILAGQTA